MRRLGPEALRAHDERLASGFIERYLSGKSILDIGYRGGRMDAEPITPDAVGVDLDYPGYDGVHLPFEDNSQDAVFASHCLEHIDDWKPVLTDWYRVLKEDGFLVIAVPHQYLYERKATLPSRFNRDHKRFYTPALLLAEIEQALPLDGYRIRSLKDVDTDFDYSLPCDRHATGRYEIELVIQKIARPIYGNRIGWHQLHELGAAYYAEIILQMARATQECRPGDRETLRNRISSLEPPPFLLVQRHLASADLPMEAIQREMQPFIEAAPFNPDWYVNQYPDIRAAIAEKGVEFAHRHYVRHGYYEGRFPHAGSGE